MNKNILLTTMYPWKSDIQLALYYLKAYFIKHSPKSNSVNIHILPFPLSKEIESVIYQISKSNPHIIGFSCYVWNITKILNIARCIKEQLPQVKIMLGGPEVSPRASQILKDYHFIDIVVIGEGEKTFQELIECWIDNKTNINEINGIAYRKESKVLLTNKRPQIFNLDEIPSPYLEGVIDMDSKSYSGYIPTETQRGCVYRCHYCYYHKEFSGTRYFSLGRVERELKYLLEKEHKGIYLMDPTFNINKERAKEILKIFIKYNKKTSLHVELRAELLDEEMIDLLYKAKVSRVEIGLQSTNRKTLKLINRVFEPDSFKRNVLLLNKYKIPYEIDLIDGLPGDNYRSLKKSIDWLFTLNPPLILLIRFILIPGSYLRQHAKCLKIKYSPQPPYYSIKSNTFSQKDLIRTHNLRKSMGILYEEGFLRRYIFLLVERLGLRVSTIFEEWNSWIQREHSELSKIIEDRFRCKEDYEEHVWPETIVSKMSELSGNFLEYLCKKYGKAGIFESVLTLAREDR